MRLEFFDEPELEFGGGGTHIDVRYGLLEHGPLDRSTPQAPSALKVGIIRTAESIEGLRLWLDRARNRIDGKETRLTNLFPPFPGFSAESCFQASLVFHERWCVAINQRQVEGLLTGGQDDLVEDAVDLFLQCAEDIIQQGGPTVVICAPPGNLLEVLDASVSRRRDPPDAELDESSDGRGGSRGRHFHDVLKAKGMRLGTPLQMVRPHTYGGRSTRRSSRKGPRDRQVQDDATRAWNLHTALYYKAGGALWRLVRNAADLTACFIGISFFRSLDGARLLSSVAQVFNERGEGVIVKGAAATLDKNDRTPHLAETDAKALLQNAIQTYRREHRTPPARVVVHKTSHISDDERSGFSAAVREERIDAVELLSVRRSFTRLFRPGTYPPLRGTYLELGPRSGLLYLRGSVNFFKTYPGLYVPRPLEFDIEAADSTPRQLAAEIFALSKLNWNNTQFDGGEPITVRAARRVGDILKCVPEGGVLQPGFRHFM